MLLCFQTLPRPFSWISKAMVDMVVVTIILGFEFVIVRHRMFWGSGSSGVSNTLWKRAIECLHFPKPLNHMHKKWLQMQCMSPNQVHRPCVRFSLCSEVSTVAAGSSVFAVWAVGVGRLVLDAGGKPFVLCSVVEGLNAVEVHLSSLMFRHDVGFCAVYNRFTENCGVRIFIAIYTLQLACSHSRQLCRQNYHCMRAGRCIKGDMEMR